jgi:uncharacterized membrane protein (UPF0127 family)
MNPTTMEGAGDLKHTPPKKQPVQVENVTRGQTLVSMGRVADNPWTGFRGLMGSPPLTRGEGLLIVPCSSIHTHFMRFPIDVLYVDRDMQVIAILHSIRPWRFGQIHPRSRFVVELPAGTAEKTNTQVGDRLEVKNYDL